MAWTGRRDRGFVQALVGSLAVDKDGLGGRGEKGKGGAYGDDVNGVSMRNGLLRSDMFTESVRYVLDHYVGELNTGLAKPHALYLSKTMIRCQRSPSGMPKR